MEKNHTLSGILFVLLLLGLNTIKTSAQVREIILWDKQDTWISENAPDYNYGHSWLLKTSVDGGESHAWIQWDLQWLIDSIPKDEEVLYARVYLNDDLFSCPLNGFHVIFINDDTYDYWDEGIGGEYTRNDTTCTWNTDAELLTTDGFNWTEYKSINPEAFDTLYYYEFDFNKSGPSTFNVTEFIREQVNNNEDNKLITFELAPKDTICSEPLFFYSREAQYWNDVIENTFIGSGPCKIFKYAPRIKVYYGKLEKQFSSIEGFGNVSNYLTFPKKLLEFWVVDTVGGDNNRIIVQGANGTFSKVNAATDGLNAMLIYNKQVYENFNVTFDAKSSKADFNNPGLIDPEDLAFVFDWVDENTYSCFLFHQIDTIGRFFKVENGKRTLTDDVDFEFENNEESPKYDDFHTYQITRTSSAMTVKIDDVTIGSTTNPEFLSGIGRIGVGALNNQVYFDNFYESTKPAFSAVKPVFTAQSVKLYPNPVSIVLNINSEINIAQVSIYNVVGSKVLESAHINKKSAQIDVSQLNNGLYFIHMGNTENGEVSVSKFLKVN